MSAQFQLQTIIDAPVDRVFDLSLDVDVHIASMASYEERSTGRVTAGRLGLGQDVSWSARHFGIRWRMTSRITELDRPRLFVDEQIRGPFAAYRHEHLFESVTEGTRMVDKIRFRAPLGPIGTAAEAAVLRRYLRQLIAGRNEYIKAAAEA